MAQIFNTVRRIVSGFGSLETLGEEIKRLKGTKVFIVSDPGIKSAGLVDLLIGVLDRNKINYRFFTEVEPDPKIEVVFSSLAAAKNFGPDLIIGLGGGSSLDISKVTSVMMTNAGPIEKYFGMELVPEPGTFLLLGSAMLGLSALIRKRRSA